MAKRLTAESAEFGKKRHGVAELCNKVAFGNTLRLLVARFHLNLILASERRNWQEFTNALVNSIRDIPYRSSWEPEGYQVWNCRTQRFNYHAGNIPSWLGQCGGGASVRPVCTSRPKSLADRTLFLACFYG